MSTNIFTPRMSMSVALYRVSLISPSLIFSIVYKISSVHSHVLGMSITKYGLYCLLYLLATSCMRFLLVPLGRRTCAWPVSHRCSYSHVFPLHPMGSNHTVISRISAAAEIHTGL